MKILLDLDVATNSTETQGLFPFFLKSQSNYDDCAQPGHCRVPLTIIEEGKRIKRSNLRTQISGAHYIVTIHHEQ